MRKLEAWTIWTSTKDWAIRAGLEPWLRPIVDSLRGGLPEDDDAWTRRLIARLPPDAVCVDVGCNKGKLLDPMRRAAPQGRFFAFEPIPYLYDLLKAKYRNDRRVRLYNVALSARDGSAPFFVNERDFGLSGLNKRPGRMDQDRLTRIDVLTRTLDGVLGEQHVDLIKIDVEGAEFDVLLGARRTIARSLPIIVFEFGLGGADYFGVDADTMYHFFGSMDYELCAVDDYVRGHDALSLSSFRECFDINAKYNFVAAPSRKAGAEESDKAAATAISGR